MSLTSKIVAHFLVIAILSLKGAVPEEISVWGAVDQDINLNIPGFQMSGSIDDVLWKKDKTKIAQFKKDRTPYELKETYQILANGTLKIKQLKRNDSDTYKVTIYNTQGKNWMEKTFVLKILEMVSQPEISWNCTNTTLTCKVTNGTDSQLQLYLNGSNVTKNNQTIITYKWPTKWKALFKCTASNKISEKTSTVTISCTEKGLDVYLIIGICIGGTILILFVSLLIFYNSKRKRQSSRRNDEELEIRDHIEATKKGGRKPHQIPDSTPQNPAVSQPPPPPGHRPQAPGYRPGIPGHRVLHQQQKRPPPPPHGTQVHQQKGPPLPRPRVQQKPPRAAAAAPSSVS
ncbi:T-cell surface antigen CD2 isoform X1 [Manis javanica]|uniref:T-cell surface antigen CD2 isoform X1 n=1 Tax=Manis javanica TaxID=9974 RepID=UPI000813413B|nr:T-cell surface antigen CD2 isoform X1 [Manis javanica]KAI5942521.1 T-cell surface antigen CD2 [Manis javanica]